MPAKAAASPAKPPATASPGSKPATAAMSTSTTPAAKSAISTGNVKASTSAATATKKGATGGDKSSKATAGTVKSAAGAKASSSASCPVKAASPKATSGKVSTCAKVTAKAVPAGKVGTKGGADSKKLQPGAEVEELKVKDQKVVAARAAAAAAQAATAEAEMEQLRQAAWVAQVEYDRKQEAKRRAEAEAESKHKKEEAALRKSLLEAAFDGEVDLLKQLLEKGTGFISNVVDTADAHGNTLLSEASAGGSAAAVQLLLGMGAHPNSNGEFGRSPLWRAAFLGHADVIAPLLAGGADPRICNLGGESPIHMAASPAIKEQLSDWDCSMTDQLMVQWQARQAHAAAAAAAAKQAALVGAEEQADEARKGHERCQLALLHARKELEKRIFEHDTCVGEAKSEELLKITEGHILAAQATLDAAQVAAAAAGERLDLARLKLRDQQSAGGKEVEAAAEAALGVTNVDIKDLDDVLIKDVGDRLLQDGRWPLVMDTSGRASVFLRYLDTNYVNLLSPHAMEAERLRTSLLGALRYGKPLVLDLLDVDDMWQHLAAALDTIQSGLFHALLDRSILQPSVYAPLIKPEDGEAFEPNQFQDARLAAFKLILLRSSRRAVPEQLAQRLCPLRVLVKG